MATVLDRVNPAPAPLPLPIPLRPAPVAKHPRRHWTRWASIACVAVALAVGVELWRIHSANAIGYDTVPVERGPIQASVTATGTLNAVVDVQVGSQVSGNIKALYADFNTKVTKGQLVAQIDPQVFQTQVDQATAALASVQSGHADGNRSGSEGECQIWRGRSRAKRPRSPSWPRIRPMR